MNKSRTLLGCVKTGLPIALLIALTGCVGYAGGGGYYDGNVVVAGPEVGFWGGGFERGHDVHAFSNRGAASRAVAHPMGGGGGGRKR
jgi:hypothetical protein